MTERHPNVGLGKASGFSVTNAGEDRAAQTVKHVNYLKSEQTLCADCGQELHSYARLLCNDCRAILN